MKTTSYENGWRYSFPYLLTASISLSILVMLLSLKPFLTVTSFAFLDKDKYIECLFSRAQCTCPSEPSFMNSETLTKVNSVERLSVTIDEV